MASAGIIRKASLILIAFEGLPSINIRTFSLPRKLTFPSISTETEGTLTTSGNIIFSNTSDKSIIVNDAESGFSGSNLTISAGNDTSIKEGETISLFASPKDSTLIYQWWSASSSVNYNFSYNPDVSPKVTSNFLLTITDQYGCKYIDDVKVEVIPSEDLVFYNSITPNDDGDNDVWYIGNLEKYPENRVQIFNRYGQEIYSIVNYKNNWNGKYLGNDLPAGTYYYVFDTKNNNKIFKGYLTIFR
jgi:gliding motility-associated-like protein